MVDIDVLEGKVGKNLRTIREVSLFEVSLEFLTVFFVCAVVSVLLGAMFYFALVPAVAFILIRHYIFRVRCDSIGKIEGGNPKLKERLKTAYDNRKKNNPIVKDLVREVNSDLDGVCTGTFLDYVKIKEYVAIDVACIFLLLFLLLSGFDAPDLAGFLGGIGGISGASSESNSSGGGGGGSSGDSSSDSNTDLDAQSASAGTGPAESIFGAPSIAEIEGSDLTLEIHPDYGESSDFDSEDQGPEDRLQGLGNQQAEATASGSYSESIPVEMEEVVRKYFERLAEESEST